jgi:sulfatase maturation enzyme AslB (radical SAM superfamily)
MKLKQFSPMKILNHLELASSIVRGENPYPVSFEMDLSNICNHDCVWCMYKDFMRKNHAMMPERTSFSIVEEIIRLGAKSITFTGGGEPLTHPETIELLPYIRQHNVSVALITNGGLLDRKKCHTVVKNCSYIRISMDAATPETHSKLHRTKNIAKDNLPVITDHIRELVHLKRELNTGIKIGVGYLVHPANTVEILQFVHTMKNIGVDYIQIRPVCNINGNQKRLMIRQSKPQIAESLKLQSHDFDIFPMLHRFDEVQAINRGYETCYAHALVGIIAADCSVYVCCQLKGNEKFVLGNLRESTFQDIWHSERRKSIITNIDAKHCPPCRYGRYNEVLEYMADEERTHSEFL